MQQLGPRGLGLTPIAFSDLIPVLPTATLLTVKVVDGVYQSVESRPGVQGPCALKYRPEGFLVIPPTPRELGRVYCHTSTLKG